MRCRRSITDEPTVGRPGDCHHGRLCCLTPLTDAHTDLQPSFFFVFFFWGGGGEVLNTALVALFYRCWFVFFPLFFLTCLVGPGEQNALYIAYSRAAFLAPVQSLCRRVITDTPGTHRQVRCGTCTVTVSTCDH